MQDDQPLILRTSRRRALGMLALFSMMSAGGFWMVREGNLLGWLPAIFFGIGVITALVWLWPGTTFLKLEADGFVIRSLGRERRYLWSEVSGFWVIASSSGRFVVFNRKGCKTRAQKLIRRCIGVSEMLPESYGMTPVELSRLMNAWRQRALARSAPLSG